MFKILKSTSALKVGGASPEVGATEETQARRAAATRTHVHPRAPRGRGGGSWGTQAPRRLCYKPHRAPTQGSVGYACTRRDLRRFSRNSRPFSQIGHVAENCNAFFQLGEKRFQCIAHSIIFSLPNPRELVPRSLNSTLCGQSWEAQTHFWEGWGSAWGVRGDRLAGPGPPPPGRLCFPASRALCCWPRLPVKFSLEPSGPGASAGLTHAF